MIIFFLICKCISFQPCITDMDCFSKKRPDVHSLFCVENVCQKIVEPGKACNKPTECSSYSFYGPIACSSKCKVENECSATKNPIKSTYCCKGIPENKKCNPGRPGHLSGCDPKQKCAMSSHGFYECTTAKSNKWIWGIFLSVSGNICINTGVNLQKKSYVQNTLTVLSMDIKIFHLGCIFYILGKIFSYAAYVFGNQSLLAALSATGLVSNSILAPMINDEKFTWKDLCAIFFVFSGTTYIVMNTKISHKLYSLCELLKMYKRIDTILWFGFILLMIVSLYLLIKYVEVNSDWELPNEPFVFMKNDDTWFEEEGLIMKYVMILAYVWLSSFIASFTTLSIKSLGEIIDKTISGENQFVYFVTYFFIITLFVCTFGQIYWLNRALRRYDALLVVPIFHITWTVLSIFTAGIYFREFEHYTKYQFINFMVGIVIIFIGSIFLATRITSRYNVETTNVDDSKVKND